MLKKAIAAANCVKAGECFLATDDGTKLPYDAVMPHKCKPMILTGQIKVTIHVLLVYDSNEPKRRQVSVLM